MSESGLGADGARARGQAAIIETGADQCLRRTMMPAEETAVLPSSRKAGWLERRERESSGVASPRRPPRGGPMPKYMFKSRLNVKGLEGTLADGGTGRQENAGTRPRQEV